MPHAKPDQPCSIARTLRIVGDYWSLVILREMFKGRHRFDDLMAGTQASSSTLTRRLKRLEDEQILTRTRYRDNPERFEYHLTERGRDLFPVILELMRWGDAWTAGPQGPPVRLRHTLCGHETRPGTWCTRCGRALTPDNLTFEPVAQQPSP